MKRLIACNIWKVAFIGLCYQAFAGTVATDSPNVPLRRISVGDSIKYCGKCVSELEKEGRVERARTCFPSRTDEIDANWKEFSFPIVVDLQTRVELGESESCDPRRHEIILFCYPMSTACA